MPPMFHKLSLALVTALLLASLSPRAEAAWEGVHPYDRSNRRPSQVLSHRARSRLLYDNAYFRRTVTYALHPFYRNNYYTLLDVGSTRRTSAEQQFLLAEFPFFRVPSATDCQNFSYYRPNYRTPPSGFQCIRH